MNLKSSSLVHYAASILLIVISILLLTNPEFNFLITNKEKVEMSEVTSSNVRNFV